MKTCPACGRIYTVTRDFLRQTSRWRVCRSGNLYFNCSCDNTIILPKGKYDWYSPDLMMSQQAASVFNTFSKSDSIPYLPPVAIELAEGLRNEKISNAQLSQTCKKDPLLSAQIISIANAARMPGSQHVDKIEQALALLGREKLGTITLAAALSHFEFKTKHYSKTIFFSEAFTTGLIAEHLCKILYPELSADLAYVTGAFCNVGKLLGAIFFSSEIDSVYLSCENFNNPKNWTKAEKECNTIGHDVLGEVAAALWGMPPEVFTVTQFHHFSVLQQIKNGPVGLQNQKIIKTVTFANQICHMIRFNSHRTDSEILEGCLKHFNMNDQQLNTMLVHLKPAAEHAEKHVARVFNLVH